MLCLTGDKGRIYMELLHKIEQEISGQKPKVLTNRVGYREENNDALHEQENKNMKS